MKQNTNKSIKQSRLKQLGLMLCVLPHIVCAQEDIILFHNCENLFYPTNDSLSQDDDFTIEGKKHWTFKRYKDKLNSLAKTYMAVDESLPAIIGLAEVENDTVLEALTKATSLRKVGYKYIHYPSKDIRGIDVALLYNPKKFEIIEHYILPSLSDKETDRTRDVLYVHGILNKLELNIYVVHAPSRREHNIKLPLRKEICSQIYSHVQTLKDKSQENFLIMGDFNDNPWDEAVEDGFCLRKNAENLEPMLVDLMANNKQITGSYVYSGTYLSFDQFIISRNLQKRIVYDEVFDKSHIFKPSFLVKQDPYTKIDVPFSTYKGYTYQGGISDHYPIILKLKTK